VVSGFLSFLAPKSVAVIGASNEPTKRGYRAVQTLLADRFAGAIYPIHPRAIDVQGLRAYPDLESVPEPIDLALVCTAAPTVPDIVAQCGRKGVPCAVVLALGFGETGAAGAELERRAIGAARRGNVRLVGPNTSGIFNTGCGLNFVGFTDLRRGGIAILSQSGNVALALVTEGRSNPHIGFSTYIGVGNESDLRFHEYLRHLGADPDTRAIAMYVESFKEPIPFLDAAADVAREKPIVLCKGGRTATGQRTARSHTGGLAGNYPVAKACLREAGISVVERSDAILAVAECLSVSQPMRARRVAVLADGGGHATLAADALAAEGLVVPELAASTRERLAAALSPHAVTANPVDVANTADAGPGVIAEAADILLSDPDIDALLVVGMFGGFALRFSPTLSDAEIAAGDRFATLPRAHGKPILLHSIFAPLWTEPLQRARRGGIPLSGSIEMAALALGALADRSDWLRRCARDPSIAATDAATARERSIGATTAATARDGSTAATRQAPPRALQIIHAVRAEGRTALLEPEALDLLDAHGIATRPRMVVRSASEARAAAARFGPLQLALKIVSPDILHKSALGGVRLGVRGVEDVEAACDALLAAVRARAPDADIRGVLVTPMAEPGIELIVGVTRDPQFGAVMMVGLGGTLVESLADIAFGRLPVSRERALAMIGELRAQPALDGRHGAAPVDRTRLATLMTSVSALCQAHPEIVELDLNPVISSADGCAILDARVLISP